MEPYENDQLNPREQMETESRQSEVWEAGAQTETPRPEQQTFTQPQQPVYTQTEYTQPQQPVYGQMQTAWQYAPQEQPGSYRNAGAGRKESPFANSPYEMPYRQEPAYQTPQNPVKEKKNRSGKLFKRLVCGLLIAALVAAGCGITAGVMNHHWENELQQLTLTVDAKLAAMEKQLEQTRNDNIIAGGLTASTGGMTPAQVYAMNRDAVVAISARVSTPSYGGGTTEGTSSGSGFIISENGYVVTNYHVVEGANKLTVTTADADEYDATLVGYDSINDLAVLKVEATDLPYTILGSSDELIVGDQVVAIGNPLGTLTSTLTVGYISGKDRDVTTTGTAINMIQTDAAINSGNSGGPLFNMKGEVVGITTAKYSGTSNSGASIEGVGFAIPIDDVKGMISDLTELGYITGAYLGVMVSDMDATAANYYGLPLGAYVQEVTPGFCAEAAGIHAKDIIVKVGTYEVESVNDLSRALRNFKGGDTTSITVFRSGAQKVLQITLDDKPVENTEQTPAP